MHTTRFIAVLAIIILFITSCSRTMTPYEAANHGKMRKCKTLR
jgi:PBP1b-binding outer membrane lipoprotein LpoB